MIRILLYVLLVLLRRLQQRFKLSTSTKQSMRILKTIKPMRKLLYRANGDPVRSKHLQKRFEKSPIHKLLNSYIQQCDQIFKQKYTNVSTKDRNYVDHLISLLENKDTKDHPTHDTYIKRRIPQIPHPETPLTTNRLIGRTQCLPTIDKKDKIGIRAVSKSIYTIERTITDIRQPTVTRLSVVERGGYSPENKRELLERFRKVRRVRKRCHSEKDECSVTLRKGWLTENHQEEEGNGIETFMKRG